jgi:hypothetical protein
VPYVVIRPDEAEKLLATSEQEYYHPTWVDKYAEDMLNYRWSRRTDDPIRIIDDKLVSGNHRIRAIIAAGIPVEVYVEWC